MSLLNKCLNLLVYAVPIQLILLQKICCRAGLTEYVVDTDPAHLCGLLLGKKLGNCTAETADHGSFLHGDDLSCLRSAAEDQLLIERLDGMDVDDFRADALFRKLLSRDKGRIHAEACGYDRYVRSFSQKNAFSDLELIVRSVIDYRNRIAAESEISGPTYS